MLLLALVTVWGMAYTAWGTQRIVNGLSSVGVRVTVPQGSLLGDFSAELAEIDLPRGGVLRLDRPSWQGLSLFLDPGGAWWLGLRADRLDVRRAVLTWVPSASSDASSSGPVDLSLPLSVQLGRVKVGEFHSHWIGTAPLKAVDGSVVLSGGDQHGQHRVRLAGLTWDRWSLHGQAELRVRESLKLSGEIHASGAVSQDLTAQADLKLRGSLRDMAVQLQARVRRGDRQSQTMNASAQVQPFLAWPVSRLEAAFDGLNLADLHSAAPATGLFGRISIEPKPHSDRFLTGRIDLENRRTGRWGDALVPVRAWQGSWAWRQPSTLTDWRAVLSSLTVDWRLALPRVRGSDEARLSVQGGWGDGRELKLTLMNLEPQALYRSAPALSLRGEVSVAPERGKPGRMSAWDDTVANVTAHLQGEHGPLFAASALTAVGKVAPIRRRVKADLEARYEPGLVSVSRLSLASDGAVSELRDAQWRWSPAQAASWRAQGSVRVRDFDPRLWLPWPENAPGRNALSAQAQFEMDAAWRGYMEARLEPSWLAGVPLQGEVRWSSPRVKQLMSLGLAVDAAGNLAKLQVDMPWTEGGAGRSPKLDAAATWRADVDASGLHALQPMAALLGWRQLTGSLSLTAHGQGFGPRLRTDGQAKASGLSWLPRAGEGFSVAAMQADWGVDARVPGSTLRAQVEVQQMRLPGLEVSAGRMGLKGSVQNHEAQIQATLTRQPAQAAGESGAVPRKASLDRWMAEGKLQGGFHWGETAQDWRGQIQDLTVRMGAGDGQEALRLEPVPLVWQQRDRFQSLALGPGRAHVMGAVLQLREAAWAWADRERDPIGLAKLDVGLEALNVSQLLARWQPKAGWGGDLIVEGGVKLIHQRGAPWVVDASVQRRSGDISLSEPTIEGSSAQRLGIRDARVTLQSRQGTWILTESFEGRSLGKLSGQQVVKAADPMAGPQASDPLQGELDLSIGNLRPWGTWIPAGWRVSGQLQAKAALDGTLGAPRYSGLVEGDDLGVGQALLGVNLSDGKLRMSLRGDLMVLEHFEARGGSAGGRISAQGQASFGDVPQARLSVTAERFPLFQRVDRRVVVSGVINGGLEPEMMEADGRVRIDEGLIDITQSAAPTVGEDVMVLNRPMDTLPIGQPNGNGGETHPSAPTQRKMAANIAIDLGQALRIKGMGLDALLAGQVRVSTPSNRPALNGAISVQDGTFAAYGQKLVVNRGSVIFTGPVENPRLDILAMRPQSPMASRSDVKVGVAITGTAQDPRIRLYSEPAMSETEKLSWLVLGRAPTGLGGADIGLLQTAAVALLSGEGASPSDNLVSMLGLDELSVRQTEGTVRETVVNVGKQVSRYWYVGYERNLNATAGNWQMIYTLARSFTLRLQAGLDNAADLIWSWRWD